MPADAAWIESARDLSRRLRSELPEASWTRPESWHLTLHFLGEISEARSRRFASDIGREAEAVSEGDLLADGAVVFPLRGPARVLGVGFLPSPFTEGLAGLAAAAEQVAPSERGPKRNTRDFHPHVTLARIRRPWPPAAVERYREAVTAWRPPAWRARSCVLFRSRLEPAGAVHTPIQTWSFSAVAAGAHA